jgi:transcriptional regulator of acetoin/glycerol metabolism
LRQRSDRPQLLEHLLAQEAAGQTLVLEPAARQALLDYHWPGNVRQLRNVLRTQAALCEDGCIRLRDFPAAIRQTSPQAPSSLPQPNSVAGPLDDAERSALLATLQAQRWHMSHAAEQLGISRNTLYRKLRKHGIERSES